MKTQEHTAGAEKAAKEISWLVRHSTAFDQELAAEIIDRETKLPQLLEALESIRTHVAVYVAANSGVGIKIAQIADKAIRSAKGETL